MKIQLALDLTDLKSALRILKQTKNYIDIIEVGTPLIKEEGLKAVRKIKSKYPHKSVVADLKTMDTGFLEASQAFKSGADMTTVCASASDYTIKEAVSAAKKYNKKVMVDLIGIKDKKRRERELNKFNFDYICIHTGIDEQQHGHSPIKALKDMIHVTKKKVAVAGGINLDSLSEIKKLRPDIVIVGGYITKSKDPKKSAKLLKDGIQRN